MIPLFNFKSSSWVGLDIHANEVRLVVLKREKHSICLKSIGVQELKPGVIMDGRIADFEQLQSALRMLVDRTETRGCPTVIALPAQSIITHRIQSPSYLTDKERELEISLNLKNYFPDVTSELAFDFAVLHSSSPSEYDNIVLVAVRLEQLMDFVGVVNKAGLMVKIADIDSFALARSLKWSYPVKNTIAIFDGKHFFVFHHHELLFSQSIVDSHASIVDCIQQLKRAIRFCLSTHRELHLDQMFLCGKDNAFAELAQEIQKECSIRVNYIDPFAAMKLASSLDIKLVHALSSRMLVSCGLALRSVLA